MRQNIILAGVGGQGILSIAYVLDNVALGADLQFKQAEVHGMAQRGGAVQSHLRISDGEIHSDLIPDGMVDLILSVEPLEALRYVHMLKPDGAVVTSSSPFVNITDYPDLTDVVEQLTALPKCVLVDADGLARSAGSRRASNMVMLGAAADLFFFKNDDMLGVIGKAFEKKGDRMVKINHDAFRHGLHEARFVRQGVKAGLSTRSMVGLIHWLDAPGRMNEDTLAAWKSAVETHPDLFPMTERAKRHERLSPDVDTARRILDSGQR